MGLGRIELPPPRSSAVCSPNELQPHNEGKLFCLFKFVDDKFYKVV